MSNHTASWTYVGLDVHADTITVAVAEGSSRGRGRGVGTIPNRSDAIRKAMKKLGRAKSLRVCYEAGPTGYALYWQLHKMGLACEVIAPTLVPVRTGDRIKTDKRDALKLAQTYRAGELTPIFVPDAEHQALRDLVRAREAAKKDQLRARHRLGKFLLRLGRRRDTQSNAWGQVHWRWLDSQVFDHAAQEETFVDYKNEVEHATERVARLDKAIDRAVEQAPPRMQELVLALQSLRGVATLTAVTVVSEVGSFERFPSAQKFMAYLGLVPSEHSSGRSRHQGGITKTGNAHLRRVLGESAFCGRLRPRRSPSLKRRQQGQSQAIVDMAWEAQKRLYQKHGRMRIRAKSHQVTVTAMSRELAGFVWVVGRQREAEMNTPGPPVERFKEAGKHPYGKDNPRNQHAIGTAVPNSRH
jgi:transposase